MSIRQFLRPVRLAVLRARTALFRRLGLRAGERAAALPIEVQFWERALSHRGRDWDPAEYELRTAADRELQPELRALIEVPEGATACILDVGAGPLTTLGKVWPGRTVIITAVDPLASEYDELLEKLAVAPPVRTTVAAAETLDCTFAPESFDLAYSSNALDHSRDPVEAIRQMLRLVKTGACVYLWHFANEGVTEDYQGLHQWNFDIRRDDFVIGDGRETRSLRSIFGAEADLSCEVTRAFNKRVVIAVLRKRHRSSGRGHP